MTYRKTHNDGNTLKNQLGTGERKCKCGSWINHWKKFAGQDTVPACIVKGCNKEATVGAHVEFTKVSDLKGQSFIAPMCDTHNNDHDLEFLSKPNYRVARGNQKDTCD